VSLKFALPAEIRRGLFWGSRFESAAEVADDGGTVTGAPTYSAAHGVTLDGANDYITYNMLANEWTPAGFSCEVQFTPTFALDDGAAHFLFDGPAMGVYSVVKNAADGLQVFLGNVGVGTAVFATVAAAWNALAMNTIEVTSTSGNTSMWLNGTQIIVSDATAWTPIPPAWIVVGATNGGASKFAGTIHSIKFFNAQLTDQEGEDYSNGVQWDYHGAATPLYTGRLGTYDPAHNLVLDASGNGRDGTISGATKVVGKPGYLFDGNNDYINCTLDGGADLRLSVACWAQRDANGGNDDRFWTQYFGNEVNIELVLRLDNDEINMIHGHGGLDQGSGIFMPAGQYDPYHLVSTFDSANVWRLYVNGALAYTSGVLTATSFGTKFRWGYATVSWAGTMWGMAIWERAVLTPLQIADLYEREMLGINNP